MIVKNDKLISEIKYEIRNLLDLNVKPKRMLDQFNQNGIKIKPMLFLTLF